MSKIPSVIDLPNIPVKFNDLAEVRKHIVNLQNNLYNFINDIYTEFNGKVDTTNMYCKSVTIADTGNADTDFAVAHNLSHADIKFTSNLNANPGAAASFYKGSTTWTENTAYLRCNLAHMNVTFLVWA